MASAFVSCAHEDQEFVLVLVEHLQAPGLDVRYDQVALHIGDSLIRAISREITEGDFLIAIVSPDSRRVRVVPDRACSGEDPGHQRAR
jgi:TIR domain